jgi:hypothetical protein
MTYHEMMKNGRLLMDKHGLTDWVLDIQNLRNTDLYRGEVDGCLGTCRLSEKRILIHFSIGRRFRQTLLHEIAHALRGESGHDQKWIDIAERIGCTVTHLLPYAWKL